MRELAPEPSARGGIPADDRRVDERRGNTDRRSRRANGGSSRSLGFDLVAFHANRRRRPCDGGPRAARHFDAVLDFTTTELCFPELGGLMDAGPTRMEAAGRRGCPVLVPGCIDFITTGRYEDAEREFPGRRLYRHNPELTLVRLNGSEMRSVGEVFARKASAAPARWPSASPRAASRCRTPTGGPFRDEEADFEFIAAVQGRGVPERERGARGRARKRRRFRGRGRGHTVVAGGPLPAAASTERSDVDVIR